MSKIIYENFIQGLSPNSLNVGSRGMLAEARDIDLYRNVGFLSPTVPESSVVSSTGGVLQGLMKDVVFDPSSVGNAYATDGIKLYKLTNAGDTFNETAPYPIAFVGKEVFFYKLTTTRYLFCIGETEIYQLDTSDDSTDATWLTQTCTSGAALTSGAPHPKLEWNAYVWIGDGQYLAKLDGASDASGAWTAQALDLGADWEITSLFPTDNYIGVCAWKKANSYATRTESAIFFWDGTATAFNYKIPVPDNYINASFNNEGNIFLITRGRGGTQSILRRLVGKGTEVIRPLELQVGGITGYFNVTQPNTIDVYNNILLMGASRAHTSGAGYILGMGSPYDNLPETFNALFSSGATSPDSNCLVGCIKHLRLGNVFLSFYNGTDYFWSKFATTVGNSTNAYAKLLYTDFGQKVRINYVKFYFKALVASDDVTPTLELDYGTSFALADPRGNANISFTNDGAITSKRFNVQKDCHAVAPALDWTAGGVAFSKVVIDYDELPDDY